MDRALKRRSLSRVVPLAVAALGLVTLLAYAVITATSSRDPATLRPYVHGTERVLASQPWWGGHVEVYSIARPAGGKRIWMFGAAVVEERCVLFLCTPEGASQYESEWHTYPKGEVSVSGALERPLAGHHHGQDYNLLVARLADVMSVDVTLSNGAHRRTSLKHGILVVVTKPPLRVKEVQIA